MKPSIVNLAVFCFLVTSLNSLAQTALTSLRGVVRDPSGAVIPSAQIKIIKNDTGFAAVRTTTERGEFNFEQIPPGSYVVQSSASGFATENVPVELLVNRPANLDLRMSVSGQNTTVEVSAAATSLNTTDATIGTPFDTQQIQALPFEGNNIMDLLSLQAGVLFLGDQTTSQQDADSRSGAVNGSRSDQGNVTLDGIDDNNQTRGYAFQGVLRSTRDSLQEFRVVTTNSNADSGRSSGAQVSLVTRSGTNKFHGSAYEYYRPTNTVANDWFNKQAQAQSGQPNIPPKLLRNTYGASLGGPIIKDKLFFFSAYEGQKTAENTQVTNEVPLDTLKNGQLIYIDGSGATQTLGTADLAKMDPNCSANGSCPLGPGVNSAVMQYFAQYPTANGSALGDGYNLASYTFSSPSPASVTTLLAKLDYQANNSHRIFVRGNLQDDNIISPEQFLGSIPNQKLYDNTKGISGGDTWTITSQLINNVRYGFIRQGYAVRGATNTDYVTFNSIASLQSTSNTSQIINVPVHNVVDDVTWTKGKHTLQFGANYRAIFNNRQNDSTLLSHANVTYSYLTIGSIAGTSTSLDPSAFGYPAVGPNFKHAYNVAVSDITGLITHAVKYYNYQVNGNSLVDLPAGQWSNRHFFSNEVEYYLQDSWKITPKLNLTVGLRHSFLQPPYERDGQQVAPSISLHNWFQARADNATRGVTQQPEISFVQGGQANGKPGLWNMDKFDLAPRLAFAYSPNERLVIRGGYGLYYDHFGVGVIDSFDQRGSFGLSTQAQNGVNQDVDTAPRFSSATNVPTSIIPPVNGTGSFPVTPPNTQDISWSIDDKMHTPYAHVIDFSIQQQLGNNTSFEIAYTGRLGRHLLQMLDLAMPLNLVDPKSGSDYFTAATQLSKFYDEGLTAAQIPAIPYWEDMFPLAASAGSYSTATQNIYNDQWQYFRGNETAGLYDLDLGYYPGALPGQLFRYFDPQYASLYAWASIGTSSYHALQASIHHPFAHGLQFDGYYTFSKSLDLGSDAERSSTQGSTNFSTIINSFNPKLNKAVSDFDVRHNITANFIAELPFGRGARFAPGANRLTDTLIGGWTVTWLAHWSSGLPWGAIDGYGWGTNWDYESWDVATKPIQSGGRHADSGNQPNAFASQNQALANIRAPYPGETGQRNFFRGQGYFALDSGLSKAFHTFEGQQLKFAWEVLNATNSVRFDPNSVSNDPFGSAATFGRYSSLLTANRRMQFSLRYSF